MSCFRLIEPLMSCFRLIEQYICIHLVLPLVPICIHLVLLLVTICIIAVNSTINHCKHTTLFGEFFIYTVNNIL